MHFAHHPCVDELLLMHEYVGRGWMLQDSKRIMNHEIAPSGVGALGTLFMGYALNAYWCCSILCIDDTRHRAPFKTATSLQAAVGLYSGIIWAIENPDLGVVDHRWVLEIAQPFLGNLEGIQTNWMPLDTINALFHKLDGEPCPWQFEHFTAV